MPTEQRAKFFDLLIFGGGLAGSILHRRLSAAGLRCLLIDEPSRSQCSRVAAGLINPIAGKRFKPTWRAETFIPEAIAFYRELEADRHDTLFRQMPIIRLLANEAEAESWNRQSQSLEVKRWVEPIDPSLLPPAFADQRQGFCVRRGGCLDTAATIELLRSQAEESGQLIEESFAYSDIDFSRKSEVRWRDYAASRVAFCEGHLATHNPWFSFVPFNPAKGVIGEIELLDPPGRSSTDTPVAIIKSKFYIPQPNGRVRIGATYRWDDADDTPDDPSISELETFIRSHLGDAWRWSDKRGGVRPTIGGGYPLVGPHPDEARILAFNGFGSKGSQQIPAMARMLGDFLLHGQPLPPEALPARFAKPPRPQNQRWIATDIVRRRVEAILNPGDCAIDATLGNGHDAVWLCQSVGRNGIVFAFDIQGDAIVSARKRLQSEQTLARVACFQADHQRLGQLLPSEQLGRIAAIVFNLGYLPGGDPAIVTQTASTLPALAAALPFLRLGGLLAVTLYPGHPGGAEEAAAVLDWSRRLDPSRFAVEVIDHPKGIPHSPFPLFVTKL